MDKLIVEVKVTPKSKRPGVEVVSVNQEQIKLKVKVSEPPEDGKANKEVIESLADFFNVPKSKVELKSGHTSRDKVFFIEGVDLNSIPKQLSLC